jgi:hypothetical protein
LTIIVVRYIKNLLEVRMDNKKSRSFLVYYIALGVAALALLIVSFAVPYNKGKTGGIDTAKALTLANALAAPTATDDAGVREAAANAIEDALKDLGIAEATATEPNAVTGVVGTVGTTSDKAYWLRLDGTLSSAQRKGWEAELDVESVGEYMDAVLTNLIVYVPGKTANAPVALVSVGYAARYNETTKRVSGVKASEVAAVFGAVEKVKSEKGDNALLFVFADGESAAHGLLVLRDRFAGFEDAVSRVAVSVHVSGVGTEGPIAVLAGTTLSARSLSALTRGTGVSTASYAADGGFVSPLRADPYIVVGNALGASKVGSANDLPAAKTVDTLGTAVLGLVHNGVPVSADAKAVTVTVFGANLTFSRAWAYVLGGLTLALCAAAAVFAVLKKKLGAPVALALGAFVQLVSLAAALGLTFGAYYLVAVLMAGFGVVNVHALSLVAVSNLGILIGALVFGAAVYTLAHSVLAGILRVRAQDSVRAATVLWALGAAITAFVFPEAGLVLIWLALLQAAVQLVTVLAGDAYKNKTGNGIQRLLLPVIPVLVTLPLAVGALVWFNATLGAAVVPLIVLCALAGLAFVSPYLSFLTDAMDSVFARLPKHTVRVQRTEVQRVEDKAKRGKFTEKEVTSVTKEKRTSVYHPAKVLLPLAVVGILIAAIAAPVGRDITVAGVSKNLPFAYENAVLFVYDGASTENVLDGDRTLKSYWQIKDLDIFNAISEQASDFKYNAATGSYVKEDTTTSEAVLATAYNHISLSATNDTNLGTTTFTLTPGNLSSRFDLRLQNTQKVTKIEVKTINNHGATGDPTVLTFEEEREITLLGMKGETTITVTTSDKAKFIVTNAHYTEVSSGVGAVNNFTEWTDLLAAVSDDVKAVLRTGIRITKTLSLS